MTEAREIKSNAGLSTARLVAVQAVYQMRLNEQSAASVKEEYAKLRLSQTFEDTVIEADRPLFLKIMSVVVERFDDLQLLVQESSQKEHEALIYSILICGAAELLAHLDIDAPVIINEYLDVTHAFYDTGESKLVNGVLDAIAGKVRDS